MIKVISSVQDDKLAKRPSVVELQDEGPAKFVYAYAYRKSADKVADKFRRLGAEVMIATDPSVMA